MMLEALAKCILIICQNITRNNIVLNMLAPALSTKVVGLRIMIFDRLLVKNFCDST